MDMNKHTQFSAKNLQPYTKGGRLWEEVAEVVVVAHK